MSHYEYPMPTTVFKILTAGTYCPFWWTLCVRMNYSNCMPFSKTLTGIFRLISFFYESSGQNKKKENKTL